MGAAREVAVTVLGADFRFGSITNIELRESDVRFTPEIGLCGMRTRSLAEKGEGGLRQESHCNSNGKTGTGSGLHCGSTVGYY
jgi:hypothetical protein